MNKFNLPVLLPPGIAPVVTQGFGPTDNPIEPRGPNGENHFHYGVDLVFGKDFETYGTPLVVPFERCTVGAYMQPPGTYQNTPFVEIDGIGASGTHYKVILAHVGNIFFRNDYKLGDIVATVGNYGMVSPQPTPADPFAGSHLHLGVQVGGEWRDPFEYFDVSTPFVGAPHDPNSDVPRLLWAIEQLTAQLASLTTIIKQ